ncbi:Protein mms22 [Cytospora mali]|uniref:Protein mms22 n=1 Tax=Cytospora mali TaxID=578113 RepID=A0A194V7W3_CYTMA|nr:Protein mms22 [Valsa mali var. pyri (nom. inval.)]
MGNWKELGVVPDSDDEGFDSEDSLPPPHPQSTRCTPLKLPSDQPKDDVWEFPSSSLESLGNTTPEIGLLRRFKANSKPRSTTSTTPRRDAPQPQPKQRSRSGSIEFGDANHAKYADDQGSGSLDIYPTRSVPTAALPKKDSISPSIVQITAPSGNPFPGNSLEQDSTISLLEEDSEEGYHVDPVGQTKGSGTQGKPPRRPSPRGRRSLRPRKPIQQHPYLLENAQYSSIMKSHGVKPVRISLAEQEAAKLRSEEDSQGRDYTADESQELRMNTASGYSMDDVDELALSPSLKTSSPRRQLRASSERTGGHQTDDTSITEDEDFPDIRDLTGKVSKTLVKKPKRRTPIYSSTSRKRLKTRQDISAQQSPSRRTPYDWDIPLSPGPLRVASSLGDVSSPDISPRPFPRRLERLISLSPFKQPSPPPELGSFNGPVDLTHETETSEVENTVATQSDHDKSDSESDIVRQTVKRIRGVLPASWLRLDQQPSRDVIRSAVRRHSPPRPPAQPQKGVAVVRQGCSKSAVSTRFFLDELNDDRNDDATVPGDQRSDHGSGETWDLGNTGIEDLDDSLSVIEEDSVDRMLSGGKRKRTSMGPRSKRMKGQQSLFKGQRRYRQPKISSSLRGLERSLSGSTKTRRHEASVKSKTQEVRAGSPPALSIVDVVEPNAPRFIKIAARAASRRLDMGRSKPRQKNINLGNRTDNVDALSVLRDWKVGKIKRKAAQPRRAQDKVKTQQSLPVSREPLRKISSNITRQSVPRPGLSFTQPQKLARQVSMDGFVQSSERSPDVRHRVPPARPKGLRRTKASTNHGSYSSRPAQLEDDTLHGTDDFAFNARKKMLDLVFQKGRKEILAPTFHFPRPAPDRNPGHEQVEPPTARAHQVEQEVREAEQLEGSTRNNVRPRRRKLLPPKHLDLEAPQFKHANDPLPFFDEFNSEEQPKPSLQGQSQVLGLGPFGTQYTQHFDIFPLHDDVFFHHATIVGDGTLKQAISYRVTGDRTHRRGVTSFSILHHHFQWSHWTDTTSSELGLVFDLLAEQLPTSSGAEAELKGIQAITCADHVLKYMLHSVNIEQESTLRSFSQRVSDLLLSFLDQTKPTTTEGWRCRALLEANSRFLICALVLSRLCQSTIDLFSEALQAEELIKQFGTVIIKQLLSLGLSDIRAAYGDLQRLSMRERGIRNDQVLMICWVIVMKVLGSAHIPRAGFWELTYSLMANADILQTPDAQKFDALWRDMVTLLPLGEFDDEGVLIKGMRHIAPLHGWSLPQKLLKRVFESYLSNPRQSPSFNEYCRALLGRCHYLVEQWGWYKCSGIVGTIFDFFGQQNLSHLRNEEVYQSPRFLEELSGTPYLSVEPEDRCFHIFLKMLAVAIETMKNHGLTNDIRNLIARTLPNHNRQYSKEQTIHAHDLAALRNHHDLLCTLFWAAPPEERPAVHLIEKLVSPAGSHKEACLVNLRAWSQLARFVVSSGCTVDVYRPFIMWQNNVFQQVLDQYLSAATDIQRQFMSMSKEARRDIGQQMLEICVSANQAASKDVLYFSVIASRDVIGHCPSLSSATFSLNASLLNSVFTKLSRSGNDLDWGILRASFEIVDIFLKRIEVADQLRGESCDSLVSHDSREFEDAVEFLDDKVVQSFFVAVRQVLSSSTLDTASHSTSPSVIQEKSVILCGKIASLFIRGGKMQLRHFFSGGKYGIFETLPSELSLNDRTYLPLFVATLLKNHVFDFSSIGCSQFDIWMLALVKPFQALRYETYLAETLKSLEMGFTKSAVVMAAAVPEYSANRDFFAIGMSYMRKELRQADSTRRKPLRAKYEKLLKMVMQQMRTDIKSLILNSDGHKNYIYFIREIVALIKSHGADICPVDAFYYQFSTEYKPAEEDPQLHSAGIIAYGLRLGEGEITAVPQLFYYLYNHFKLSIVNRQLDAESQIIENSMTDDNILTFVLSRMLPAIIRACFQTQNVWPLLGVYSRALRGLFGRSHLPREVPESLCNEVVALLSSVPRWLRNLKEGGSFGTTTTPTQLRIFTQLMEICNAVRPTLICWLMQPSLDPNRSLLGCVDGITQVARQAVSFLDDLRGSSGSDMPAQSVPVRELLTGLTVNEPSAPVVQSGTDGQVDSFTQHLLREVQRDWVVTTESITIRTAITSSAQPGTQPAQGITNDLDGREHEVLLELYGELKSWIQEMGAEDVHRQGRQWRRKNRRARVELLPM